MSDRKRTPYEEAKDRIAVLEYALEEARKQITVLNTKLDVIHQVTSMPN